VTSSSNSGIQTKLGKKVILLIPPDPDPASNLCYVAMTIYYYVKDCVEGSVVRVSSLRKFNFFLNLISG